MNAPDAPLELWGGVECTVNRVGDRWFDQLTWSGHDGRLDDLGRFAALGIRVLRYPILWERLAPDTLDRIDWRWADERMSRLRDLNIRPIVGFVHHGSGPAYTSLLDPAFPEKLARFAEAVARRYPWVQDFTPVNEPLTTARFSGLYGHWYPHARSDREFVRMLLNQLRGIVMAMDAVRQVTPGARLIQTEDCGRTFGTPATRGQVRYECQRRWLTWDLLCARVGDRHPLRRYLHAAGMTEDDEAFFATARSAPEVLGLNYYVTSDRYLDDRLDRYPSATHGGNGRTSYADVEAVRARERGIAGFEHHLLSAWRRYGTPMALTEVHLGCTREEQARWLLEGWRAAHRARAKGAAVCGVTAWALVGSFNWHTLVTRDDGQYEPGAFDVTGPHPRATALASVVAALATGRAPRHPVIAGTPWWRRPERLVGRERRRRSPCTPRSVPLLVIGSTGTLGRAFQRICRVRGLPCLLVGRQEVDIADASAVDAVLRRTSPWAVINAAGYVRVDTAEREPDVCHRSNVLGPVALAAACRRRAIRFVTFSSDLVFDGRATRPYVEADRPRPLSVYGVAKAEAERRVLELSPEALVIRTSAFFGPWDDANFVTSLMRRLDAGLPCFAAADNTVSPTYVPDLVHASLDLLIDGASGIWHLANRGAATWYELAVRVAELSGRARNMIVPVESARIWQPAERPPYSVLSSERGRVMRSLDAALAAYLQDAGLADAARARLTDSSEQIAS